MTQLVTILIWAAIVQGILLGILYLLSRQYASFPNKLLGLFLLTLVTEALSIFLPVDSIGTLTLGHYFAFPEVKLFLPPLLLHYTLAKTGRVAGYKTLLRIFYLLAVGVTALSLINAMAFFLTGRDLTEIWGKAWMYRVFIGQQVLAWLASLGALVLSIHECRQAQRQIAAEYSDITRLEIRWLWQFVWLMAPITLLWGAELLRIFLGGIGVSDLVLASWGVLVVFIYFVSYKAFTQKNLFEESSPIHPIVTGGTETSEPHQDSDEVLTQLEMAMREQHLYLQQDLSLHELAKALELPSRKISQVINQHFNQNFSLWVNHYRVQHAIAMLGNPEHEQLSVEGIGQESGFKSRSAMYLAFQKLTGNSPGAYKRQTS